MLSKTAHPAAAVAAVRLQAVADPAGAAAGLASSMAWLMLLCAVLGKGRGGRNERGRRQDHLF